MELPMNVKENQINHILDIQISKSAATKNILLPLFIKFNFAK
jgi:hypothetical protein